MAELPSNCEPGAQHSPKEGDYLAISLISLTVILVFRLSGCSTYATDLDNTGFSACPFLLRVMLPVSTKQDLSDSFSTQVPDFHGRFFFSVEQFLLLAQFQAQVTSYLYGHRNI